MGLLNYDLDHILELWFNATMNRQDWLAMTTDALSGSIANFKLQSGRVENHADHLDESVQRAPISC